MASVNERLPGEIREIAARQVERLAAVVAGLSDSDLVAPTLCAGWLAAHLLAHCRSGPGRARGQLRRARRSRATRPTGTT